MIRRLLTSRGARKFRRNRLAMASLALIVVYAAIAVAVGVFGLITLDEAEGRVGPDAIAGALEEQTRDKRLRDARFYIGLFERALRQEDPEAGLAQIRLGMRRPPALPVEEIEERVGSASEAYDDVIDLLDELEFAQFDLEELLAAADADPEELASLRAQIAELDAQVAEGIARVEGMAAGLLPRPEGVRGVVYDLKMSLGTDRQGRSIMVRAVYSVKVAVQVGLIVAVVSVLVGTVVGAAAAFFGGWVDHAVVWLYSTLSSIPELVLLAVLVYMFMGSVFDDPSRPFLSLVPVYAAMCMLFWIGPCRVIRGETMKLKQLEYVQAATAIGFGRGYILLKHVIPNTVHLMFINFSLLFIAAIKFEVVLSFLGLGVKVGPSWGKMIGESAQEVINGFFWQIGAATAFMFVLVLAFNIVSDALQDAFDPKHV